ncbi:hypothetical protein, partial [Bacteroides ovatus]|uniref:hypothetical protein n=1 Tax=Bacteroides ovatus TaxID=28116 RepID=UPI00233F0F41
SLCANIRIFTTITSDEQYFLNEKAVSAEPNNPLFVGVFSFFDVYLYVVDMTCCIVTLNDVVSLKLLKSKHIYNF